MKTAWSAEDALIAANQTLHELGELVLEGNTVRLQSDMGPVQSFQLVPCDRFSPEKAGWIFLEAQRHHAPLVVCPYVGSQAAQESRRAGVSFVDSAGNVFLKGKSLLVWQVGAKPIRSQRPMGGTLATRAFQPRGVKFLYEIMTRDCSLIAATYRELNDMTGASLGAIGWILRSLKENGFLVELDGGRRLTRTRELLDQNGALRTGRRSTLSRWLADSPCGA